VRPAFGQAQAARRPNLAADVIDSISAAKSDERIKLIVLDLGYLSTSGLSKLQKSARMRDFRASGKRVVAAADSWIRLSTTAAASGRGVLGSDGQVYLDG